MSRIMPVIGRICVGCEGPIPPEKRSDAKYCSPDCQQKSWHQAHLDRDRERGQHRYWEHLEKERERNRERGRRLRGPKSERFCGVCRTRIPDEMQRNAKYCSEKCRATGGGRRRRGGPESPERLCLECGLALPPKKGTHAKFCSLHCCVRNREKRPAVRLGKRPGRMTRRAREKLAPSDPYTLAELLERDGYCCHLCGGQIDPTVRYPDRTSASVDHIVPLARGGTDLRANVAPAHLACNQRKHTRVA